MGVFCTFFVTRRRAENIQTFAQFSRLSRKFMNFQTFSSFLDSASVFHLHFQRIEFKVILTCKAIHGVAPPYLSELIAIKGHGANNLRLSNGRLLVPHPRKTKKTLGDRSFGVLRNF